VVQIRLFGDVGALDEDGRDIDVGPAKCQTVLAALALAAGSAVPVARLIALVWGDEPPRTAEKTLQSYVTRLRKGLGADSIDRVGVAYRLNVSPEAVDVLGFQRAIDAGDIDGAVAAWHAPPMAGLAGEGFRATIDGLTEQWLGAVEVDLEHKLDAGGADSGGTSPIIGSLTELTATYPFREGLWALLMTALYRAGRQADALAAYRTARSHLVEQLGVEPGPRLRELETSILGQDALLPTDRAAGDVRPDTPSGTVTFGFCEVEDASLLWASHRQIMSEAMVRYDQLVAEVAATKQGYVFASGGESFGVAFHRAGDALGWAEQLGAIIESEPWPQGLDVRVRFGLHTGETDERGSGYFGPAVTTASRLAAAGHGGQILASGVTASLVGHSRFRDLGVFRLEGIVDEQRIMQLGDISFPPLRTDDGRRGNLSRHVGRLIGRHDELALIEDALSAPGPVTLVGPGGIGKTRLAMAAGRRWEMAVGGGAWFVELASTASPHDVPRAVADALGLPEQQGRTLTESVVQTLSARRALLILDNCEHVVDGAADIVRAIVAGSPDTRVLATSREGLGVVEEQLIAVPPLDLADAAVELFTERASAASQVFDGVGDRDDVVEICRRLDGVPLAIELAAARIRSLSPADLVERLDDRLRLLSGGRRGSVERHRTLRATIQWSYDLLSPEEQLLFQRLSIFAGPFDLAAAEAVAADVGDQAGHGVGRGGLAVDQLLGALVDRSMVSVESGQFSRRFRLLETMRQFGAEHLSEAHQTDLTASLHASWCLGEVTAARKLLEGHGEIEGVARLAELWRNLRAAFEWACTTEDHRRAYELIRPIGAEVYLRSQTEIGEWAERLLSITPAEDSEVVLFGLNWAARRYMRMMDAEGYEQLVATYGEPDEPSTRYARAFVSSDRPGMLVAARETLAELEASGDRYGATLFETAALDYSLMVNGKFDELEQLCQSQVTRLRSDGPPTCLNWSLTMLGFLAAIRGEHEESWERFSESADVAVPERTHSLLNPLEARAAFRQGKTTVALERLGLYIDDLLENENLYLTGLACIEFIDMMSKLGRLPEAARMSGTIRVNQSPHSSFFDRLLEDFHQQVETGPPSLAEQIEAGAVLSNREALLFMRDTLNRLVVGR
jgi:predicted ATPase/DNA-binding SARP family transcriptional activator